MMNTARYTYLKRLGLSAGLALLLAGSAFSPAAAEEAAPAPAPAAMEGATIVVLDASNRTGYGRNKIDEVLEEYTTTGLVDGSSFSVVDKMETDAADTVEGKLSRSYKVLDKATKNLDPNFFASVLLSTEKPIYEKAVGDTLKPEDMQALNDSFHARYLLHPTLEVMEVDRGGGILSNIVNHFIGGIGLSMSDSNVKMKSTVTYRLIDADTGKIVWMKTVNGKGKNSRIGVSFSMVTVEGGNDEMHNGIALGSIESVAENGVKALETDLPTLGAAPETAPVAPAEDKGEKK